MEQIAKAVAKLVEDALKINPTEMLIQILATLLLFIVIKLFFWEKITLFIEERGKHMEQEVLNAEEANKLAQENKEFTEKELHQARLDAKTIIDNAKSDATVEKNKIVGDAKEEASKVLHNAKLEIESEYEKVKADINDEIVSVATLMAEKIIKKEIDPKKHKDLIDEVTKGVSN